MYARINQSSERERESGVSRRHQNRPDRECAYVPRIRSNSNMFTDGIHKLGGRLGSIGSRPRRPAPSCLSVCIRE